MSDSDKKPAYYASSMGKPVGHRLIIEDEVTVQGNLKVQGVISSYGQEHDYYAMAYMIRDIIVSGQLYEEQVIQIDLGIINHLMQIDKFEETVNNTLIGESLPIRVKLVGLLPVISKIDEVWKRHTYMKLKIRDMSLIDLVKGE